MLKQLQSQLLIESVLPPFLRVVVLCVLECDPSHVLLCSRDQAQVVGPAVCCNQEIGVQADGGWLKYNNGGRVRTRTVHSGRNVPPYRVADLWCANNMLACL